MQAFSAASNCVVRDSTFVEVNYSGDNSTALRILFDASIPDAVHDSRAQEVATKYLPKVPCEGIVDQITTCIHQSSAPFSLVWHSGPKSNLTHLCAERLSNQLAATFFFSRKCHLEDPRQFFTTIACQLAILIPAYEALLEARLRRNPSLVSKRLEVQFRELIEVPFRQLERAHEIGTQNLILVDGLDECDDLHDRYEILRIINGSKGKLPFRWLIFCRSDVGMRRRLAGLNSVSANSWELISANCYYERGRALALKAPGIWLSRGRGRMKREYCYVLFIGLVSLFD
ncbi:hypothetical protein D9756_009322 [Leucocoprinus leucothites]|uniref:Nephrocystin 3-like N-terminal domain-containing protein n=1 Tax=Leucocoprinus leucothites TaxID=201217 RepID=A0A8H5CWC1_9AGAR|nr:hypothetical protein D9756_009322 [Leucoagaricus leucothites]